MPRDRLCLAYSRTQTACRVLDQQLGHDTRDDRGNNPSLSAGNEAADCAFRGMRLDPFGHLRSSASRLALWPSLTEQGRRAGKAIRKDESRTPLNTDLWADQLAWFLSCSSRQMIAQAAHVSMVLFGEQIAQLCASLIASQ
jgi:hypothetical protein